MKRYPGEIEVVKSIVSAYKDYINKSNNIKSTLVSISTQLYNFDLKTSNLKQNKNDPIYKEINKFSKEVADFLLSNLSYFKKYPQYNIGLLNKIIDLLIDLSDRDGSKSDISPYIYRVYKLMSEFSGSAIENSPDKGVNVSEQDQHKFYSILEQLDKFNYIIKKSFSKISNGKGSIDDLKKNASDFINYIEEIDKLKYMAPFSQDLTNILVYCYKLSNIDYPKNDPKQSIYYIDYYILHLHKIANFKFDQFALYANQITH